MNLLKNKLTSNSYIIIGEWEEMEKTLLNELSELGIEKNGNPDFYVFEKDNFYIEDVREVGERAKLKAIGKTEKKVFLIKLNSIGIDAQNAFLKILEEPTPNTHFFIIAPQNIFLPTILSRVELIKLFPKKDLVEKLGEESEDKESFLEKNIKERLEYVAKLCKDISDEKREKQDALELINQIESEILNKYNVVEKKEELKNCELARKRLLQKGAMVKMILEDVIMRV